MIQRTISFLILLLCVLACGSHSLEDYREEADGITRSLIKEMQAIHSREDLLNHTPRLKKLFNKLVDVIIAAHEFKAKHPSDTPPLGFEGRQLSDSLHVEISRLYTIDGVRDVLEKAQQDALYRLDAYLQKNAAL